MKHNIIGTSHIMGEQVFQIGKDNFSISPSSSGYIFNWSVDGVNFDAWEDSVPANENVRVLHCQPGAYYKLVGNTDEVIIMS